MSHFSSSIRRDVKPNQTAHMISSIGSSRIPTNFEEKAIQQTILQWSSLREGQSEFVVSSESDISTLRNLKNVLFALQTQFTEGGSKIVFAGEKKDDFNKRLLLLENEIQGLLKRKINYGSRDQLGGTRYMDYSVLLNEKQTQIVQLEKKINNLEERLRKSTARQLELENHITQLYADMRRKEETILSKNQVILAEVAASNNLKESMNKLKRNIDMNRSKMGDLERILLEGIMFPEVGSFDISADVLTKDGAISRSKTYQIQPENQKNKTQLIQLFRQFERMNNQQGITDVELEKIMENFLLGLHGSRIRETVSQAIERRKMQEDYGRLKEQFGVAVGILQGQIDRIKRQNPSTRIDVDPRIFEILRDQKISVFKTAGDIVHLERFSEKVVEVPVQDARTKQLIHLLAVQMKKFTSKYPKLQGEMDGRLAQFFQEELIDTIEVDEMDRLVSIVKFIPQVVKVENVYAYSSQKSRKVQFHLRVLIKALLEELEKLKKRTGAVLELDEGIIGMINQEIMGVVDVDDILKVFRVVPKIVEVEKIVEKVVDRIVEVPQVVPVEKIIEKVVQIEKIKEIEKVVNVPLEVPTVVPNVIEKVVPVEKIIEKVIQVPQIIERIVQVVREVPKVQVVNRVEEKVVEVEKFIEVEKVVNHVQPEVRSVEVVVEKVIPTERVVEKIVEVPVLVEKIVEKVVQVPQVIEVEKVVEKIVQKQVVMNAKEVVNHVEVKHEIVDRIIEKPVPIVQTIQKLIEVPQVVEKVVTVEHIVREPFEVPVNREKVVVQDRIKQIQQFVQRPVTVVKEVPREVEKIVQIPIIHERMVKVQQIIEKPLVQRVQNTIVKEVFLRDPIIIKEPKTIEVQKVVNHYIDVPKPIKYIEEKIVEVIRHVDRIKEVKVPVEKVIEKMVEVPKVVQVEKVVEKVVVVPRVVEKVVQVPQIVERVVPKVIVEEKIRQVQKTVQLPIVQERVVEVEVPRNIYVEVEKVVEKIVDKLVEVPRYEQKVINTEVIVEKVIEVMKQVPRTLEIQKLIHNTIQVPQIVEIQKQLIVPVEVPIPVEKIVEKIVPATSTIEKVVQVPQVIEKIIPQKVQSVSTIEVTKVQQNVVVDTRVKQVVKEVPYVQDRIKQVQTFVEKVIPVQSIVQEVVSATQIVEKVVERSTIVPKVHDVERVVEKVVEIPKIVQVQRIIPQLVNVNRYIQNMVEKIVEVPIIVERVKQIVKENEKVVEVRNQVERVKQVEAVVEKAVVMEKFKEVVRNVNHIEKVLQIVDRHEQVPVEILAHEQKLVEVPYILQKIVEKIVVMPQIVQVLKYVHQLTEKQDLGVAVGVDVASHEQKYRLLSKDIKTNLDVLLVEIRKLKGSNPQLRVQVELIERFLAQFEEFILYPKIVQVPVEKVVEKVVEKDKVVSVPTQDERSMRMQLTLSLLVQKLILEMKRVKRDQPSINWQLEEDIKLIFFSELESSSNVISGDFNSKLKSFSDSVHRRFQSLGNWSYDHQMMLNTFLQERFLMANLIKNANLEIQKSKTISLRRDDQLMKLQSQLNILRGYMNKLKSSFTNLPIEQESIFRAIISEYDGYVSSSVIGEPMKMLGQLQINDMRLQSLMREKDAEILSLRDKIFSIERSATKTTSQSSTHIIKVLQDENIKLKNQISDLRTKTGSAELVASYQAQIKNLNGKLLSLEQQNSNLTAQLSNLKRQYEVKMQLYEENSKILAHTRTGQSFVRSPQVKSHLTPQYKMVESEYKKQGEDRRGTTARSIELSDSGYSRSSATQQYQPERESYEGRMSVGDSSISGSVYQARYQTGGTTPQNPYTSTYQTGGNVQPPSNVPYRATYTAGQSGQISGQQSHISGQSSQGSYMGGQNPYTGQSTYTTQQGQGSSYYRSSYQQPPKDK